MICLFPPKREIDSQLQEVVEIVSPGPIVGDRLKEYPWDSETREGMKRKLESAKAKYQAMALEKVRN